MQPSAFVIILNFNGVENTLECVESVRRFDYGNFQIVILDNASSDKSEAMLRSRFSDAHLIANDQNYGYAEGNNIGIRYALSQGADYVFILNNDTVADQSALRFLIEAGEKDPNATILAPKVCRYHERAIIDSCGTRMNWFRLRPEIGECGKKDGGQIKSGQKDVFPGSALVLKKKLFKEVGFFDAKLFLIHEDADLCFRNKKAGYRNVLVPQAVIYHKVTSTLSRYPFEMGYYSIRNLLYVARKHCPWPERFKPCSGLVLLCILNLFRYLGSDSYGKRKLLGFFAGVRDYFLNRMGKYQYTK